MNTLLAQIVVCDYYAPCNWPPWLAVVVVVAVLVVVGANIVRR